ncbi:pex19p [Saccharomyces arboricola H-6]|uniref:Peroxisomal membrane protein import receptor PEX19 n=1 Tax=Saccharomyces arboricola (strain H-6 / AS 2.3317 / CBS 10644) TaxID=1160507 RepID=J8PQD5_SACAR|nr:pex19p [Saccharomyces arboricola H-6]
MSENEYDDFDDLDDLLDEDPTKLDEAETGNVQTERSVGNEGENKEKSAPGKSSGDAQVHNGSEEDPELKEMMTDLQNEFANLMKQSGDENNVKTENFNTLMSALEEATKPPREGSDLDSTNVKGSGGGKGTPGFKSIVSNTLDRLKENGSKVDTSLAEETKESPFNGQNNNVDDILSQLLNQMVASGANENGDDQFDLKDGEMDDAITKILDQMTSKEVLYEPMKEMRSEFGTWFQEKGKDEEYKDKIDVYNRQFDIVKQIVDIYELKNYDEVKQKDRVTELLDELEQLGDSPIRSGNSLLKKGNEEEDLMKMLEVDGDDPNLGNLDKELADGCKQQ